MNRNFKEIIFSATSISSIQFIFNRCHFEAYRCWFMCSSEKASKLAEKIRTSNIALYTSVSILKMTVNALVTWSETFIPFHWRKINGCSNEHCRYDIKRKLAKTPVFFAFCRNHYRKIINSHSFGQVIGVWWILYANRCLALGADESTLSLRTAALLNRN